MCRLEHIGTVGGDIGLRTLMHSVVYTGSSVGTSIKAVLSDDEGMGQKAYRNSACIMPGCTGERH